MKMEVDVLKRWELQGPTTNILVKNQVTTSIHDQQKELIMTLNMVASVSVSPKHHMQLERAAYKF